MKRYTVTLVEQVYYECEVEAASELEANWLAKRSFADRDEYQSPGIIPVDYTLIDTGNVTATATAIN